MNHEELFYELDLDGDGFLSRQELFQAACRLGWHWHEAPLYAILDYLTVDRALSEEAFLSCMMQVAYDPDGIYGDVLLRGRGWKTGPIQPSNGRPAREPDAPDRAMMHLDAGRSALLIIDPQRSFVSGEWMRSLGIDGEREVLPIRRAFANCAALLEKVYGHVSVMFTRCPFPPESYGWDAQLDGIIDPGQPYFIKPGNSVLLPRTNGFREWVGALLLEGVKNLVMGGCTLNSCVRISALETQNNFRSEGLQVVVDLSLSGARASNYAPSVLFDGMSSVELATREMSGSGIRVVERVEWC